MSKNMQPADFPAEFKPLFDLPELPSSWTSLVAALFAEAAANPNEEILSDKATGQKLTRAQVIAQAAAVARVISQTLPDNKFIGIIMPPTVAGALVNVAVAMLGKVAVNLNYGAKTKVVNYSIDKCGITDVIAVPALLEKLSLSPKGRLHDPETLKGKIDGAVMGWVAQALAAPAEEKASYFPGLNSTLDDIATILFTTGSTGAPKATVLDQRGIMSNMFAIRMMFEFQEHEKLLGCAPFFHALGFTGTIWTPLILSKKVVYFANSLDARKVCELIESEEVTIVLTTPSLMRMYVLRATAEQFKSVRHIVLGAEKVKPALRAAVKTKTGLEVEEAYGATEFGPLITANVNRMVTLPDGRQVFGNRPGSAGLPAPGVALQIRDRETGEILAAGKEHQGLICARGPQRMVGYLDDAERTDKAVDPQGWYLTGDIGYLDEDGFLWITGRASRFAKIAGEMVPVEELESIMLSITDTDETSLHVSIIPEEKRGERLILFYTDLGMTPQELFTKLGDLVPALWVPGNKDFVQIEKLPMGATNKVDMQQLKKLAIAEFGE